MDMGWMLPLLPYGEHWRRSRKLLHTHTHAGAATNYQPVQLRGAREFVRDLLAAEATRPEDKLSEAAKAVLPRMVQSNFGVTGMEMVYGIRIRGPDMKARFLDIPETINHAVSESASPGRFLVDFFPSSKFIP
jgi:cytochrome P450